MASPVVATRSWKLARIRSRWRARPPDHSRSLWTLLIVLDVLPWPWGEDILAGLFTVVGLLRPKRRRPIAAWASALAPSRSRRLTVALCAFRGHQVARLRLLGFRHPDDLRRNLIVEGAEHLNAVSGAAIILGFHVGPSSGDLPFRVLGYPVTFIGWSDRHAAIGWWNDAWRPLAESSPLSFAALQRDRWAAVLYAARQTLLDGGKVYIMADGRGREAFRLPLSVGDWPVRAGWVTLHQLTGAPVLPVLDHLAGHRHVMTIHPPLPTMASGPTIGVDVWRHHLTRLLDDYVRRFPEQCPNRALAADWTRTPLTAASAPR